MIVVDVIGRDAVVSKGLGIGSKEEGEDEEEAAAAAVAAAIQKRCKKKQCGIVSLVFMQSTVGIYDIKGGHLEIYIQAA